MLRQARLLHPRRCLHTATAELLKRICKEFPNDQLLYSRIDILVNSPGKVRVALIPFHVKQTQIKGVLDNLLADPLASDQQWHKDLKNREPASDSLIRYSKTYETKPGEFSVPFSVPQSAERKGLRPQDFEIIETSGTAPSACHRHVYITSDISAAYGQPLDSAYPHDLYLDLPQPTLKASEKVTIISSPTAARANDLFQESPARATEYLDLLKSSNISAVQQSVFGHSLGEAEREVLKSIAQTCKEILDQQQESLIKTELETRTITQLREEWAQAAHAELQTTYTDSLKTLINSKLPWWKLYFKVDDVFPTVTESLVLSFLPKTKRQLEYLTGRVDEFVPDQKEASQGQAKDISSVFNKSRDSLISEVAVKFHNKALREVLTTLSIQITSIALPVVGMVYFGLPGYSLGFAVIGVTAGAVYLQRAWTSAGVTFLSDSIARAKLTIEDCERAIWQRWEQQVQNQKDKEISRQRLLEELSSKL